MEAGATADQGLVARLPDGEASPLLLPLLMPPHWRALGRACRGDRAAVLRAYREAAARASAPRNTTRSLVDGGDLAAAALRFARATGIEVEALSMPKLVSATYTWAHYGRRPGERRPKRRLDHLNDLVLEFADGEGPPGRGIQVVMRCELVAVQVAIRLSLVVGGDLNQVDQLDMVPEDTPGKLQGTVAVNCLRARGETEATALMWSTRYGVRWVEMLLRLGADASQVTPEGWTALLYGAAFESRGVVQDGTSDSGEDYGGYQRRSRGVVGPLVDAGAALYPTLPLEAFHRAFGPSPVGAPLVGPMDVARVEASARMGWAGELLLRGRSAPAGEAAGHASES